MLLTCAGALLLVLLANAAAGLFLARHPRNLGYHLIREKWRLLDGPARPASWLVLGDSSCNQGVVPSRLARGLGAPALNLCTIGDMLLANDAWMLEAYVGRHGPPAGVVLVHVFNVWHREASPPVLAQAPLGWLRRSSLRPRLFLGLGGEISAFLHRTLPLYAQHQSLAAVFKEPARFLSDDPLPTIQPDGFMAIFKPAPAAVRSQRDGLARFARENGFKVSGLNRESLERMIVLAEARGFDLYFAPSPMDRGLYRDPAVRAYLGKIRGFLEGYEARSTRFRLLLREPALFDESVLENADHLVFRGAWEFTGRILQAIREGGERVALDNQ